MATLDDIARRLGTTKGTVSKALNGAPDVSEAMRKAVIETAVELGYSRTGRNSTAKRICIFIENMAYQQPSDFGYDLISGFRKVAVPAGFQVDIVPLTPAMQKEQRYDEYMLLHDYQGAFFLGLTLGDHWMKEFQTCRTPAVLYDNEVKGNPKITSLAIDNEEGMSMAVEKLRQLGHEKIGYLSGALGSHVYQARYKAFFRALRQKDLPNKNSIAGKSYYLHECLSNHLPRLLNLGCTAIICCNDILAHSVMMHCGELGLRVPQDVSIIGVDDLPMCQYTCPPLTTIRQNRDELGKSAFYALGSHLNQVPISALYLHPELVVRESIGPAPIKG